MPINMNHKKIKLKKPKMQNQKWRSCNHKKIYFPDCSDKVHNLLEDILLKS